MGYGEFVGNRSVHWKVIHEEKQSGSAKTMKVKSASSANDYDVEPLSNAVKGHDRIKFEQIGQGKGEGGQAKDHTGRFRVRARFESLADAQAAALWAYQNVQRENGMYVIVVEVPAVNRPANKVDPPTPLAEVRVDW
jgi:hypothetical protein